MRNSSISKKQNEGKQITLNRFFRTVKCKKKIAYLTTSNLY